MYIPRWAKVLITSEMQNPMGLLRILRNNLRHFHKTFSHLRVTVGWKEQVSLDSLELKINLS